MHRQKQRLAACAMASAGKSPSERQRADTGVGGQHADAAGEFAGEPLPVSLKNFTALCGLWHWHWDFNVAHAASGRRFQTWQDILCDVLHSAPSLLKPSCSHLLFDVPAPREIMMEICVSR